MEASQTPEGQAPETEEQDEREGGRKIGKHDERNPAADQAPIATEAQDTIIGDPGLRDEQQPRQAEGAPTAVNTPHATSGPPPSAQSGVPLAEDRAAGVEPGEGGPEVDEDAEDEAPEHDASGGQSTTPPLGG